MVCALAPLRGLTRTVSSMTTGKPYSVSGNNQPPTLFTRSSPRIKLMVFAACLTWSMISWLAAIAAAKVGLITRCKSFGLTTQRVSLLIWMAAAIKPFLMYGAVLVATSHLPPPAAVAVAVWLVGHVPPAAAS